MKNLLVPTDFSAESHHAFAVALQLAHRTGGTVNLLHVVEQPGTANFSTYGGPVNGAELPNSVGMDDVFMLKLLQVTKERMSALIEEAAQLVPGVTVQDAVEVGTSISDSILTAIDKYSIDLVVIGAQDHSTLDRFFESTHTEQMVRTAPCPVLAVKHAQTTFDVKTIVFPSDFSAETEHALADLQRVLAVFPQASLHLLEVSSGDAHDTLAAIQRFAQQHQLGNATPAVIDDSDTSDGIRRFAEQVGADLIVLPTHGRTGLSSFFQSSVAEEVATQASTPVLTFHLM